MQSIIIQSRSQVPFLRRIYVIVAALMLASLPLVAAEFLAGAASNGRLVLFPSDDPSDAFVMKIRGLEKDEEILGLDVRPATGELYALGSSSRLYKINVWRRHATPVGETFSTPLSGQKFGFDFNPTVDRIRVVSDSGQNLRLHPDTGAVVGVDTNLAYAAGDSGFGTAPTVAGAAYTNNDNDPATGTFLYDIDAPRDALVVQNPPNAGTLTTIGSLGVSVSEVHGFDVASSDGTAYAALADGHKRASLYSINLATGEATLLGRIGGPKLVSSLATLGPLD